MLQLVQQAMLPAATYRDIAPALRSERVLIINVAYLRVGVYARGEFPSPWYARGYMQGQLAEALEVLEPLTKPSASMADCLNRAREYDRKRNALIAHNPLAAATIPRIRMMVAHANRLARVRCTVAGLAAEQYRLRHGRWPLSSDELLPEFIEAVPLDPFTDSPLIWRNDAGGLSIYSVGEDGIDDGGQISMDSGGRSGADIGFRLINPQDRAFRIKPAPDSE